MENIRIAKEIMNKGMNIIQSRQHKADGGGNVLEKHKAIVTNWNQIVGEKYNNISAVNKDKMEKAQR